MVQAVGDGGSSSVAREPRFHTIDGEELYRKLAYGEPLVVLDVRTESEYAARHIPGSLLLPLHELESRLGEIPPASTPTAVVCEHGIRSISACGFLSEHGFGPLFNLAGGLATWPGPTVAGMDVSQNGRHLHPISPSLFLIENFDLLPRGLALDLAMGEGRNAIYLATRGFDVDGVDVDPETVARARARARRLQAPIRAVVGNVEDGTYIVPLEAYDVIVVFNYLHRPLFNDIRDGLKAGGVVVYQTYTTEQARYGRPTDPAHLLEPGELRRVFADWEILRYRESTLREIPGGPLKAVAGIVARKPPG
jgi:rhodanese-related sulfurtransferase